MKTKEQILNDNLEKDQFGSNIWREQHVLNAMDEYAKQCCERYESSVDWISIVNVLPKYYESVLCMNSNSIAVCWRASNGEEDFYTIDGTDIIFDDVTHWLPLDKYKNLLQ